jgi:ankyrin repeat protein
MRPAPCVVLLSLVLPAAACRPVPRSPLVEAVTAGRADEVARLIANGASPAEHSGRGITVLGIAARMGRTEVIEQLVKAGADPDIRDSNENQWTPLLYAVDTHQYEAVRTLLRLGADPDIGTGLTPLIMAAGDGDDQMLRVLLDHGADPHRTVRSGENALGAAVAGSLDIDEWTVSKCRTSTVKLLLDRAPDLRLEMLWAARPLTWPARLGNCTEVLALLEGRDGRAARARAQPR